MGPCVAFPLKSDPPLRRTWMKHIYRLQSCDGYSVSFMFSYTSSGVNSTRAAVLTSVLPRRFVRKPPLYCVEILPWMNSCLPTWLLFFEDQILDLSGTERGEKWLTRLLAAWQIIKLSAWFFFFFKLCLLLHSLKHVPVPLMFIQ